MNSETGNEFEAEYHDRFRKIRKAAAIALKELDQLRSGGPIRKKPSMQRSRVSHERSSSRTDAISLFIGGVMASRDS
jgi:hypothetical protein